MAPPLGWALTSLHMVAQPSDICNTEAPRKQRGLSCQRASGSLSRPKPRISDTISCLRLPEPLPA
eukprot:354734-Chlamydomonas_euryale.AAC.2